MTRLGLSLVAVTKVTNAYYECACSRLYYIDMIYSDYVIQTYSFDLEDIYNEVGNTPYYAFLLRDGTIDYRLHDSGFPTTIGQSYSQLVDYLNIHYYTTYVEGQNYNQAKDLMAVLVANNATNDYAIINTSLVDFNLYTSYNDSSYNLFYGKPYNDDIIFNGLPVVYDYSGVAYNSVNQTSNATLVTYNSYYMRVVLDYYNIVSPLQQEYYSSYVGQYWQIFHKTNNFVKMLDGDGFTMSLGSTYEGILQQGYDNGYSDGYINGYNDGFTNGSRIADGGVHDAFNYISEAFNGVAGIMNLQVLPNISLGLVFSIPLTIVLIMTIFKLVRK